MILVPRPYNDSRAGQETIEASIVGLLPLIFLTASTASRRIVCSARFRGNESKFRRSKSDSPEILANANILYNDGQQ